MLFSKSFEHLISNQHHPCCVQYCRLHVIRDMLTIVNRDLIFHKLKLTPLLWPPSSADVLKDKSHVMYEGKHIHFSEVDNKPLCSYSPKLCKQRRLNGYAFCIRHVLEDKTAPFKQCEYVAKYNSQRCTNPIPKSEDRR